jgi:hypothetical protein
MCLLKRSLIPKNNRVGPSEHSVNPDRPKIHTFPSHGVYLVHPLRAKAVHANVPLSVHALPVLVMAEIHNNRKSQAYLRSCCRVVCFGRRINGRHMR